MNLYRRAFLQGISRIFSLPSLSLPIIISLGLTMGAVLSVAAIVSTLMLKPLPGVKDESGLYNLTIKLNFSKGIEFNLLSWSRLAHFQKHFADAGDWAAITPADTDIETIEGETWPVTQFSASSNILDVLGTKLLKGQNTNNDNLDAKIWISNTLWQQAFSGRESALGSTLQIKDKSYVVTGIIQDFMAIKAYKPIIPQQVWLITDLSTIVPEPEDGSLQEGQANILLRSALPPPSETEIKAWYDEYLKGSFRSPKALASFSSFPIGISVDSYRDNMVAENKALLQMLLILALGLLTMASLNLLNLFISHYQGRNKEFALQTTLGASRKCLFSLIALENLPTFATSAMLGLLAAGWLIRSLPLIADDTFPMLDSIHIDSFAITVALLVTLLLTALFSLLALRDMANQNLSRSLNGSGKGSAAQTNQSLRRGLMILQLCIASILLTGSVMLAKRSFDVVYQPLGYSIDNAYAISWGYGDKEWAEQLGKFESYQGSEYQLLHQQISKSIEKLLPEAEVVTTRSPLAKMLMLYQASVAAFEKPFFYQNKSMSHNSFSAFDIKILAGHIPTEEQLKSEEYFVVIDRKLAEKLFPDTPLSEIPGRTFTRAVGDSAPQDPIIAVVENTLSRTGQIDNFDFPTTYSMPTQNEQRLNLTIVMPDGRAPDLNKLSRHIAQEFPRLTEFEGISLNDIWKMQTLEQRITLAVILMLTALILLLAVVGIAGLTKITTNQQRYELAIRMATGASQGRLLKLVFKEASWMLGLGLGIGFILAVLIYQQVKQQLNMLPDFDWLTMLGLDSGLIAVVMLAVAIPAWRIIKANPMQSLREL